MNGKCSTPTHKDRPARLYPAGWLCSECAPGAVRSKTILNLSIHQGGTRS